MVTIARFTIAVAAVALTACAANPSATNSSKTSADSANGNGGGNGNENGSDQGNDHDKITICHATGSKTNPYVEITVDVAGLNGHGDHPNDIIPAPAGGCPTSVGEGEGEGATGEGEGEGSVGEGEGEGSVQCSCGQTACGDVCVDTSSDVNNCGACGVACAETDQCIDGTCVPVNTGCQP